MEIDNKIAIITGILLVVFIVSMMIYIENITEEENIIYINNTIEKVVETECEECPAQKVCEKCIKQECDNSELIKERLLNARLIGEVEHFKEVTTKYLNRTENLTNCLENLTMANERINKIEEIMNKD